MMFESVSSENALQFKVLLLGDQSVGKTSIRYKYLGNALNTMSIANVGADISTQTIIRRKKDIKLQIWDIIDQNSVSMVKKGFYFGSSAGIIIYDVLKAESFASINTWVIDFFKQNGSGELPIVLIGNKIDLRSSLDQEEVITPDQGRNLADDLSTNSKKPVYFMETSALTGENIDQAFKFIVDYYLNKLIKADENVRSSRRMFPPI